MQKYSLKSANSYPSNKKWLGGSLFFGDWKHAFDRNRSAKADLLLEKNLKIRIPYAIRLPFPTDL